MSELTERKQINWDMSVKMTAIQMKYFDHSTANWEPEIGDYYTVIRNDLSLFQINRLEGDDLVVKEFSESGAEELRFPWKEFATMDFHQYRVHVHSALLFEY